VSPEVGSVVLFTMLLTSVLSTYGILFNHEIATALARFVAKLGLPIYTGKPGQPEPAASSDGHGHGGGGDVFLLGVSREGLAFVQHLERESPEMKAHLVAVDFNPETLASLQADGVECHYGDIANVETLRHAGIDRARIVVLSVSDWFLKGTSNLTLLRVVRGLAPKAQVIATADRLVDAETLYSEGAAYVLIPPALSAEHLYRLLLDRSEGALEAARAEQMAELFSRGRAPAADAESGGRV
jgi:Trk K+ transport system NAD-binding subunit